MTSLLPRPTRVETRRGRGAPDRRTDDQQPRRPLALVSAGAGAAAAAATLLACLALGLVGWYLADAGAHGRPTGGLRVGALGWLTSLGSGVRIEGTHVSAVPLGLTLAVAFTVWRFGLRVGESLSAHGPDVEGLADGERDWTVPVATALFAAGFVVVAVLTCSLASTPATAPDATRVTGCSLLLSVVVGGTAIALGSGRAAQWTARVPVSVRVAARVARRILVAWLALSLVVFVLALVVDLSTAANILSQLHADAGAGVSIVFLGVLLAPNATLFSGSYLLGPGFAVGAGTTVTPNLVVLGPLPMFPMLAALPDQGPTPGWTAALVVVPPLLAFVTTALVLRHHPTTRWEEGVLRGLAGGVVAGIGFGVLAMLAGGSVGPGRMQHVGPFVHAVLVHGVTAFGVGGLLAGVAMTWWARRDLRVAEDTVLD